MIGYLLFYAGLLVSLIIGLLNFRDLGDIPQLVTKTKRVNVDRFIRIEYQLLGTGAVAWSMSAIAHLGIGLGPGWLFWTATVLTGALVAFVWVYVHKGLRNQKVSAKFYSIAEAQEFVSPTTRVAQMTGRLPVRMGMGDTTVDIEGFGLPVRDAGRDPENGRPRDKPCRQVAYGRHPGELGDEPGGRLRPTCHSPAGPVDDLPR